MDGGAWHLELDRWWSLTSRVGYGWRSLTSQIGIDGGVIFLKSEVGDGGKFDIWSWMDGRREFDMWSWMDGKPVQDLDFGTWKQDRCEAHSRSNSRECVGILIPLVIVFVASASSPQSRHRCSQRNQQQLAYLWALRAPDVAVAAVLVVALLFFFLFFSPFFWGEKRRRRRRRRRSLDRGRTDWVAQNVNGGP